MESVRIVFGIFFTIFGIFSFFIILNYLNKKMIIDFIIEKGGIVELKYIKALFTDILGEQGLKKVLYSMEDAGKIEMVKIVKLKHPTNELVSSVWYYQIKSPKKKEKDG